MKNKIIDSFFLCDKRKDIREDENKTDLLLYLFSIMLLRIKLLN